jgi:methylmalonyl-CoA mutase N-terminal domain/subunit
MHERFGVTEPKAMSLRFHAQTGGSTLTAQQPENNAVRVAIQALSAVCGGAQSLHTNAFDEALALPSERAATLALRTQQILAHESGVAATADPLGGSYFIEALTDELEARAETLIEIVEELGGAVEAIDSGFIQAEIEQAAYEWTREVESKSRMIVGVNAFTEGSDAAEADLHKIDPASESRQVARTQAVRARRDAAAVERALAEVRDRAGGSANLLPALRTALEVEGTIGEICGVLREEWGTYDAGRF